MKIKQKNLTGRLILNGNQYLFRCDHAHGQKVVWAWDIHGDYDKAMTHKWNKMPKGAVIEYFDMDTPPQTVSYQPLID
jgi:hypothetical protein